MFMVLVIRYVQQKRRVQFVKAKLQPVYNFLVASFHLPNFNLFRLNLANALLTL